MRKRATDVEERPATTFTVPTDPVNEQVVLAASASDDATRDKLVRLLQAEHFLVDMHRPLWLGMQELARQRLAYDAVVLKQVAPSADISYLEGLLEARPDVPENLDWHIDLLLWDKQRATAATGPISSLLEALQDPRAEKERVRALARHVSSSFEGQGRALLYDTEQLVTQQMAEIRARAEGRARYPYGIDGLDFYETSTDGAPNARMVPAAAPGQITMVTGVPGSGKSTFTCHMALGLARQEQRVLYGAWEMQGGPTLELLACLSLGWRREDLMTGYGMTEERLQALRQRMLDIGEYVRFMKNPFRRRSNEKKGNDKNLDLVQSLIEDSGCDVFIADLWRRCLVSAKPEEEEEALFRQQAMAEEMRVHVVIVHQQRHKDVEGRPDKRPTREGMKGSGGYIEVADTVIGVHRPHLFKKVPDDKLEVFVLKQRYGKWPLGIEFDWNAEYGSIAGGRSIDYDPAGEGDLGELVGGSPFKTPEVPGGRRRGPRRAA